MIKYKLICLVSFFILIYGCQKNDHKSKLDEAEEFMQVYPDSIEFNYNPDSALIILNSLDVTAIKDKMEKARYNLLFTEAEIKNGLIPQNDSLIGAAAESFSNENDLKNLIKSLYYRAKIKISNEKYDEAILDATRANEFAREYGYDFWIAKTDQLIGDIYSYSFLSHDAAIYQKEAVEYFIKAGRNRDALFATCDYAINLSGNGQVKRSLRLLDSVRNIADFKMKDSLLSFYCRNWAISIYSYEDNHNMVDTCFYELLELSKGKELDPSVYFYKVQVELNRNNPGEAKKYLLLLDSLSKQTLDTTMMYWARSKFYEFNRSFGDALAYKDSTLIYQNKIVESLFKQSVVAAQRDYYDVKAVCEKERASDFRNALIISIVLALLLAILFWTFHRLRIRKKNLEIQKKATDIMLISTELDDSIKENYRLSEVVSEKEDNLRHMADKLNLNLHNLELLQADLKARGEEVDILSSRLTEIDRKLDMTGKELAEAVAEHSDVRDNEMRLKSKVESLFRNRNEFFYKISEIYITKKNSPTVKKTIISDFEDMFRKMRKEISRENVEKEVNAHMDNILVELREKCSTLSDEDLMMTALIYAGYMPRFVSEMCGYTYKYFYTKRDRIIRKIEQAIADNDRMRFIDPLRK